jgi:tetratricopeptide (TPR) repeat protein
MGAYDEAKALHERALAINDRALGSEHPDVAGSLDDLAHVYRMMGDHDRAKSLHERALVIWEQTVGVEHRSVATSLVGLAEISLAQQRPHDAIGLANRALKVREAADSPPEEVADARFVLARSLWESDREHIRAIELAKQAQEGFRRAGSGNASERAAVDAWLAEHEG